MRSPLALTASLVFACSPSPGDDPAGQGQIPSNGASEDSAVEDGNGSSSVDPAGEDGTTLSLSDGGAKSSEFADAGCERLRDTRPVAPNVQIVLDRSGSMIESEDRWTPAVAALEEIVASLDEQIRFGLTVFPSLEGRCSAGEERFAPALKQGANLIADLQGPAAPAPGGGTPTSATLDAVEGLLSNLDGTSYVLLLTDGAPNCNAEADPATCTCTRSPDTNCRGGDLGGGAIIEPQPALCLDDGPSVAAVEALASAGIRTFVIGYDTSAWSATLDAMAAAGDSGHEAHFEVSDGATLAAALEKISAFVVSCTFELSEAPPSAAYVSVTVDGSPVHPVADTDGSSGWRLTGDRTVELIGASCGAVSDGEEHDIAIVRQCKPVAVE